MLSIIIVSYNVRFFLEQCLYAVTHATAGMQSEVIVVDNHSSDGTVDALSPVFPAVIWIANEDNLGFGKACNQGLQHCSGDYILFLNPDTLVPEQSLRACVDYLGQHSQAGALGVPMIDGRGRFLPESKRAFPSPMASFYKLMGLAALFPRSGYFNRYALGDQDAGQTQKVEVLAGAFMMCRKRALETTGGFDERFFLYGEDIDLSFRFTRAGWENHYFSGTRVIHFKGESTGKAQTDHVKYFYEAMLLFFDKHYGATKAARYRLWIRLAVVFRAILSITGRVLKPLLLPLVDILLLFLSLQFMRAVWIRYMRNGIDFHVPFIGYAIPVFCLLFVTAAAFTGMYDRRYSASKTALSVLTGSVCTLALYSLLPEQLRFSRGVILCGVLLGSVLIGFFRASLFMSFHSWFGYELTGSSPLVILCGTGTKEETASLLQVPGNDTILYYMHPDATSSDLLAMAKQTGSRELVFCIGDISLERCIGHLQALSHTGLRFLFHSAGSGSIIGSDWPSVSGRSISAFIQYRIASPFQQRMKRITDIVVAFFFLVTAPVHFILNRRPLRLLGNAVQVLSGRASWIGYRTAAAGLPPLKPGITGHTRQQAAASRISSDAWYALRYEWWQDIFMVFRQYHKLA